MDEINLRAYAKVNLTLDVLRKRDDGYHDLKMIMQTVDLCDEVSITKTKDIGNISVDMQGGPKISEKDNLAYKAAEMLLGGRKMECGILIAIKKRIPQAAGMAGGSSDCAAVLKGLNILLKLNYNEDDLCRIGARLGADVPYCIVGGTALVEGVGDIITPFCKFPKCHVLLAKPPESVSTASIYGKLDVKKVVSHPDTSAMIDAIKNQDLHKAAELIFNVMEEVTIRDIPVIKEIERMMKENGALGAIMSGSGSTVFGLYDDEEKMKNAKVALNKKYGKLWLYGGKFV